MSVCILVATPLAVASAIAAAWDANPPGLAVWGGGVNGVSFDAAWKDPVMSRATRIQRIAVPRWSS